MQRLSLLLAAVKAWSTCYQLTGVQVHAAAQPRLARYLKLLGFASERLL